MVCSCSNFLVSPVEWHPRTPSTTLHSCTGLHSHFSHVISLLLHLQRSEQSFSSNQVSPAYMNIEHTVVQQITWILNVSDNKILKKMTIFTTSVPSLYTYRSILPILISAAALADRNAFVPTENQTTVTDTSLYTGLVTCAVRALRVLTAWLGTGTATRVIVTARWTF